MIGSVITGISRIVNVFRKIKCPMGKDCPFIHAHKSRSTSPRRREKGKGKDSDKE